MAKVCAASKTLAYVGINYCIRARCLVGQTNCIRNGCATSHTRCIFSPCLKVFFTKVSYSIVAYHILYELCYYVLENVNVYDVSHDVNKATITV